MAVAPSRLVRTGPEVGRARALLAGEVAPVPPRSASTVVLLRDGSGGLEVLCVRRHARLAVAPALWAFPGGGVEPSDPEPVLVSAAVRETAEETGIVLAPDALVPWARWVTPSFQPRRYDATFFVAAFPAAAAPLVRSGEADELGWLAPAEALGLPMLPPTAAVLESLLPYASAGAALAAADGRDLGAVRPGWRLDGDVLRVLLPGDAGWPGDDPEPRA